MTNSEFANLLAVAVKNGKLNNSILVNNFIEYFDGSPNGEFPEVFEDTKFESESVDLVNQIRKKRLKIKDSQLNYVFNLAVQNSAPVEKEVKVNKSLNYHAQEY